jgi:sigma-B regulation protein RsbU (phosphoserine phosphatase)
VALADVAGHGETISVVSESVYGALKGHMNDTDNAAVLAELNQTVHREGLDALTTAALLTHYSEPGEACFAYAGHHAALVRRAGEAAWTPAEVRAEGEAAAPTNIPLAVTPDARYVQQAFPVASGDRIVLYTDGVIEALDGSGEQFGVGRLRDVLAAHAEAPLPELKSRVLAAVRAHAGGALTQDDVTLIVVEVR